ncbi:oligosaccharide flippase family protein [Photobacterium damselae]|uniref:Oligosaccharide flippase family protein n=1 Tax=Photobacterium damselae subsp. damselae TaxID=85581 RepID=A0AAD3WTD9_PHODD|nr:oligosaccharide flippase family protein [Photobacterium damselae]AWK81302.1 hypothetical protein BST98_04110 [Photobacterium damselae]KAB1177928.1 oligosaccharide flippase family protein [Photobacterium damselae subsp. damselae]
MTLNIQSIIKHSVFKNATALFILQFFNVVGPLLVIPYLSRVLGVDGFGQLMLIFSLSAICVIVIDFGFNLSATYNIAKLHSNINSVSKYIGGVFVIKLILLFLVSISLFVYSFYQKELQFGFTLILIVNVFCVSFLPTWFFQAIEKMKNITIFISISKVTYLLLVFLFIHQKDDVFKVFIILTLSNLIGFLIAIRFIYKEGYRISYPSFYLVKNIFFTSFEYFISRVSVTLYTSASTFFIGSFSGLGQAAIYSAGEKLYQASQVITSTVSQALFPFMVKNKESNLFFYVTVITSFLLISGCLVVSLFSEDIINIIYGKEFLDAVPILKIFLIITVINFISVNYGYPAFAKLDRNDIANYSVIFGGIVQLIILICLYFDSSISAYNVVISILITEMVVMLIRVISFYYLKYRELNNENK